MRQDGLSPRQLSQVGSASYCGIAKAIVDTAVAVAACGVHPVVVPVGFYRTPHRRRNERAIATPSVVFDSHDDGLTVVEQYGHGHAVAEACTEAHPLGFLPSLSTVKRAAQRYLLLATVCERTLIGKIQLQLSRGQLHHRGFPAAVGRGIAGIVDPDLTAPRLAVVGTALAADAEFAVFGIGRGRSGVVCHDDGAVAQLNQVGHTVGGVVAVGHNLCGAAPCRALVRTEGYHDASTLAGRHVASVLQLNQSAIAAVADGLSCGGVPEYAGTVIRFVLGSVCRQCDHGKQCCEQASVHRIVVFGIVMIIWQCIRFFLLTRQQNMGWGVWFVNKKYNKEENRELRSQLSPRLGLPMQP